MCRHCSLSVCMCVCLVKDMLLTLWLSFVRQNANSFQSVELSLFPKQTLNLLKMFVCLVFCSKFLICGQYSEAMQMANFASAYD